MYETAKEKNRTVRLLELRNMLSLKYVLILYTRKPYAIINPQEIHESRLQLKTRSLSNHSGKYWQIMS
jgi:hypothetical protein